LAIAPLRKVAAIGIAALPELRLAVGISQSGKNQFDGFASQFTIQQVKENGGFEFLYFKTAVWLYLSFRAYIHHHRNNGFFISVGRYVSIFYSDS